MKTLTPILCSKQRSGIITKLFSLILSVIAINANAQNYLTESFDGSTSLPTGWTSTYIGGGSTDGSGCGCNVWYSTAPFSGNPSAPTHTGSGMATFNSWSITKSGEATLVTPAMDFSVYTGGTNRLSFWLYKSEDFSSGWGGNEDDSINVWINTSPDLSGASYMGTYMNGINSTPTVSSQGWYQYTITIPSSFSSSSSVYVIFDGVSDYESDLYLDDVSVDHIAPCSGIPTVDLVPSPGKIVGCSGSKVTISGTGGLATGQDYQWQIS
ncbi:MAG: choice-of-anchor J domain-containing protein, partial [Bacteroidetes bacterium]|nr:choice-of-anchor J domain-containing protein [Bacteroidota bacterium]